MTPCPCPHGDLPMPFRIALAAFLAVCLVLPADEKKDDEGWIPLFNGKDLTGWKMYDPPSGEFKSVAAKKNDDGKVVAFIGTTKKGDEITLWQVKDGMIVG